MYTTAAWEFTAFPSFSSFSKQTKLVPQVDSVSATEWLIDGGLFLMHC